MKASNSNAGAFQDRTGRKWSNRSVIALLEEAVGDETPCEIIRRKARSLVDEVRQLGWEGPPFDPEVIAGYLGLHVRTSEQDIRADGRLFPQHDGSILVELNAGLTPRRRRFTICHEIGHTLFPDCYEEVRHRGPYDPIHQELEHLCNVAAAEFLMPHVEFSREISGRKTSMHLADQLRSRFDSSMEATLRRILDLSGEAAALLMVSRRLKPAETKRQNIHQMHLNLGGDLNPPAPKLRVDYVAYSPSFKGVIPPHKSAPDDSVAYEVLEFAGCVPKVEEWGIRGHGKWLVDATPAPPLPASADRALVLVRPVA